MGNGQKVLIGSLAGLAVGTVLGILIAPDKGSNTRKKIMDKSGDYYSDIKSKFNEFADTLADKFESSKNEADNLVEKGKAKYEDIKKDALNTKHAVS